LKSQYLAVSHVAPGQSGSVSFTFQYAGKLKTQAPVGSPAAPWNTYPIAGQVTTNAADGSGSGLPYQLVATQVGVTPGA
jgi:hypothetical protein